MHNTTILPKDLANQGDPSYGAIGRLSSNNCKRLYRLGMKAYHRPWQKSNTNVQYPLKRAGQKSLGVTNDQAIFLKSVEQPLRLIAITIALPVKIADRFR